MMVSCIIVDDRVDAISTIKNHLKNFTEITLVESFTDSIKALHFLEKNKIDLVFLDIDMPDLDGLEFIESLTLKNGKNIPKFIYITGDPKYALQGFDLGASGYLLKPIIFKKFKLAIERLMDNWKPASNDSIVQKRDYFFIELDGAKFKIKYSNIAYIKSERNYINIHEVNAVRKILKKMHYIEDLLRDQDNFIRVHKSYIVSNNYVEAIKNNDVIMKINGTKKTISIGKTYKENVLKKLR